MSDAPAPRVRFAPAPTGYLHVGSARSALFNWLFARQTGAEMLLRIEDTDPERSRQDLIDLIYRTLTWLGIDWDGEPVRQSDRFDLYREAADKLLASGHAYACECTPDEVKERTRGNATPGYDGHCRDRGLEPGIGRAVRFRTPDDGTTEFDDVIRGHVSFENAVLEDFVLVRSDGSATFLLPNAVDDMDLGITHVIRGEDLVNVTPRVLLIREALGHHDRPLFAHLPLLVNAQRKKLSKRRDDVSVEDYRDRGYLPDAMANYLALLGWGPPDGVEIRPMAEIMDLFRLEDVQKASAFFDQKKLDHVNSEYIKAMPPDRFVEAAERWIASAPWADAYDAAVLAKLAPEIQKRVRTLGQVPEWVDFLFLPEPEIDPTAWQKVMVDGRELAATMLDDALEAYDSVEWRAEALHEATERVAAGRDVKLKHAQAPLRVAITGRTVGPPLFESLEVLGRESTMARLRAARAKL